MIIKEYMRNNPLILLPFRNVISYWDALTTQQLCFQHSYGNIFSISNFKAKVPLDFSKLDSKALHMLAKQNNLDADELIKDINYTFYTNSILQNVGTMILVGMLFRSLEILGYKVKQNIIKKSSKNTMLIHFWFEIAFLASTIFIVPSIFNIYTEDYVVAKLTEYTFRAVGYALQHKYSIMDYAKDINLISILNKETIKDLAVLKSLMFANNFIASALKFSINKAKLSAESLLINGLYASSTIGDFYIGCSANNKFMLEFFNFINAVEELGIFIGKLSVDILVLTLKYIGIIHDPNTFTVDTENIVNIPNNIRRKYNNYFHYNKQETKDIASESILKSSLQNDNLIVNQQISNNNEITAQENKKKIKTRNGAVKIELSELKPQKTLYNIVLPENVTVIEGKIKGVPLFPDKITTFAINLSGNKEFDVILTGKDRCPIQRLKTSSASRESPSYELQKRGSNIRAIGVLEKHFTALNTIQALTNKNFTATLEKNFNEISSIKGTPSWQCFIFNTTAKHSTINKIAQKFY